MADTSTKWGIVEPVAARTDAADVPLYVRNIVAALEAKGVQYGKGTLAVRPAAGIEGRIYETTDETPHKVYFDNGTTWDEIGALTSGAVGTTQLADNAVTLAKMADDSVGAAEIVADSIGPSELAPQAVTVTEISDTLKPTAGAGATVESLRALGTAAGRAAPGIHAPQHASGGADPLTVTQAMLDATFAALLPQTGDIKMVGYDVVAGTSEPAGWLLCDGRSLPTASNVALFNKIGYAHGGSGANFNLPDFRGRSPMGKGQGSGMTLRNVGQTLGEENHVISLAEMWPHSHGGGNHGHSITDAGHGHGINDPGHSHYHDANRVTTGNLAGGGNVLTGIIDYPNGNVRANTGSQASFVTVAAGTTGIGIVASGTVISTEGSGASHNTIHPVTVVSMLIKT